MMADAEGSAPGAEAPDDEATEHKAVATHTAKLALLGYEVHRMACGSYLVTRPGLTRHCLDAASLGTFIGQIGGIPEYFGSVASNRPVALTYQALGAIKFEATGGAA